MGVVRDDQPDAREGQAGRSWVAERFVVPMKPGNAGGGKGPQFRTDARRGEGPGDWATSHGELWVKSVFIRACGKLRGLFRYPRSEVRARLHDAARFRARSTSYVERPARSRRLYQHPACGGQGLRGRNHSINRHVGPWLPSVRPPGSARTDQVLGDLIIC